MGGGVRVLQLIPKLQVGGLERLAVTLSVELADRGRQVSVCTGGGEFFASELHAAGVPIEAITRPTPRLDTLWRSARSLIPVYRRFQPDVVHAHNPSAAIAAWLARGMARDQHSPGIVVTHHGVEESRVGRAARSLGRCGDIVVCPSPQTSKELVEAGLPRAVSATVFNAVDARVTRDAGSVRREFGLEDAELVVTVGRYADQKNHRLLVEAAAILAPRWPGLHVLLVGVGPLEADTQAEIDRRDLTESITLTGVREDAADIMAAADVFALSSKWEALPITLLEAMAVGAPLVVPAVGGIPDVVRNSESGLIVDPGDANQLAAGIERLLADRSLARKLARGASRWIDENCSTSAMADRYEVIYADAIARHLGSGSAPSTP